MFNKNLLKIQIGEVTEFYQTLAKYVFQSLTIFVSSSLEVLLFIHTVITSSFNKCCLKSSNLIKNITCVVVCTR